MEMGGGEESEEREESHPAGGNPAPLQHPAELWLHARDQGNTNETCPGLPYRLKLVFCVVENASELLLGHNPGDFPDRRLKGHFGFLPGLGEFSTQKNKVN